MSLEDVAQRLKYGTRQIQSLEEDDYPRLPGSTFVRGMMRSYAKLLEMDAGPLLDELQRREIPAHVTVDLRAKRIPFPDGSKRPTRVYVVMSVLVVLIAAAVILEWQVGFSPWSLTLAPNTSVDAQAPADAGTPAPEAGSAEVARSQPSADQLATQQSATIPNSAAAAPVTAVAPVAGTALPEPSVVRVPVSGQTASRGRIVLQFQRESWVEIKQADGRIIMSQMNRGGSEQELGGTPPFDVIIGNAPSVRLVYNGQPVDLRPHFKVDVARLILE